MAARERRFRLLRTLCAQRSCGRRVARDRLIEGIARRRRYALGAALAATILAFTVVRPPLTSGPYLRDFEAYWAAGVTWLHGGDPYSRAIWTWEQTVPGVDASREELLPFVGPAAFRPLWSAFGALPFSLASRPWAAIVALSVALLGLISLVLARAPQTWETAIAAIVFAFAFAPCISAVALGQTAAVAAFGIAATLLALERGRVALATLALVVSALQPNLALALAPRIAERRGATAVAAALTIFIASTLAFGGGPAGFAAYLQALRAHGLAERVDAIQLTPSAIAWGLGADAMTAGLVSAACALAALAVVLTVFVRVRLDRLERVALVILALPFTVPFFHVHDLAPFVFPALLLAWRATPSTAPLAFAGTLLAGIDWLGFAQRPEATGQHLALAAALGFAWLAITRQINRGMLTAALAVTVLAVAGAWAGARFPAPTWPDELPAHYHAPPQLDAAEVWHDEQRASGLEARVPAWAWLRMTALAGPLLLGVALARTAAPRRLRYRGS